MMRSISNSKYVKGVKTLYHVRGAGSPLIFLHGHRAEAMRWDGFIERLARRHKVYAPDLPGYGKTQNLENGHLMENYAQFIADFIETLNIEKPIIFGGSMGGLVGIHLALKWPEKIKKLVLFGTPISKKFYRFSPLKYRLIKFFAKGVSTVSLINRPFQKLVNSDRLWYLILRYALYREEKDSEIIKYEVNRWRSSTIKIWAETLYESLNLDFLEKKVKIKVPTLAIFAEGDRYLKVEETIEAYKSVFENLEIFKVKAKSHLPKGPIRQEFLDIYEEAFEKI